jgi:hypothetical protein
MGNQSLISTITPNDSQAIEILHKVNYVNQFFQDTCSGMSETLTEDGAQGMWVILQWQKRELQLASELLTQMVPDKMAV